MDETTTAQEVPCAYELCCRGDPIRVQPGHRPRRFHDDACRQAQHRLLKARAACEREEQALAQSWGDYLPETRQLLERALHMHGEEYAHQLGKAIAQEKLDLEARNVQMEMTLARYRALVDLQDRAQLEQQCMAVGQLLGYPRLAKHDIGEGEQAWEEFLNRATGEALAGIVVYGHELLRQAEDIRQYREEYSKLGRAERQIKKLCQAEETLKQRIAELEREMFVAAKRLADERTQALQDKHRRASLLIAELKKQEQARLSRIAELEARLQEEQQGHRHTVQSLKELKQQGRQQDRRRIKELEEDLRDYQRRCQFDRLTMLQLYLHEDIRHGFRLKRGAMAFTVIALDNGGTALTEHGAIQLTDEEIEQCRAFVAGQWKGPSTPEQQEALVAEVLSSAARIQAGTRLVIIQEYLRSHPAAVIPVHRGEVTYRVIAVGQMDDRVEAVTDGRGVIRLDDEEIAQARAWAEQHLGANAEQRPVEARARITEPEQLLERDQACIDSASTCPGTAPEEEKQDGLRPAQVRIRALERELAKYAHAPSRAACAQAFLRWGEKLGYPTLFVLQGHEQPLTLQQGREAWQQFIASLTNELLWAAVEGIEEWYYHCRPDELPKGHWLTGRTRMCDARTKMRIAEVELARYRGMLEPSARAKLEQAFMAAGAAIDYRQLTNVRAGLDGYQQFMDYSPNENLVKATVEATAYAEALAIQRSRRGSGALPFEQS